MNRGFPPTPLKVSAREHGEAAENYVLRVLGQIHCLTTAGFSIALHSRYGVPTYLWTNMSVAFLDPYDEAAMLLVDPTVRWARENRGWTHWSDLHAMDTSGVSDLAERCGMRHGVTVSIGRAPRRTPVGMPRMTLGNFARPDRPFRHDEAQWLHDQLNALHFETDPLQPLSTEDRLFLKRLSMTMVGHLVPQPE